MTEKTVVMTSFATFSPGRNWEQIRVSIAYPNLNVKIVGSHSGFSNGKDGATAQALEDIALMRTLPNMTVINPIDYWEAYKATIKVVKHEGPVYLRLFREDLPFITTKESPFEIGKAYVLSEGEDVTILSTGPITLEVLEAKRELKAKHSIDAEIISCPTIKPLDEKTILASAKKTGKVVTVEEHQIAAGFGSAVCELLSEKHPTSVLRIGVNDHFGESGSYKDLLNKHGLRGHNIAEKVLEFLK
jgi:transketolase